MIMTQCRRVGRDLSSVAAVLIVLAAHSGPARAQVNFLRNGAFETCLDAAFGKWVKAQAELQVNEDPAAQQLDDAGVAAWTHSALDQCRERAGGGDARSEDIFTRFMARWRQHVFDLAANIRSQGRSD
jgi:hypothetical protein